MKKKIIVSVLATFAFAADVQAQTVRGIVTDAASGEPMGHRANRWGL